MLMTKRKPASVGEILVEEFMAPMRLTQAALAEAMGVQRKHVNELCNDRRGHYRPYGPDPRPGIWQQPRLLAERAASQRPVGGHAQPARAQADRAGQAREGGGVIASRDRGEDFGVSRGGFRRQPRTRISRGRQVDWTSCRCGRGCRCGECCQAAVAEPGPF